MRKKLINIIGVALFIVSIVSCDTATQDMSPIVEPDDSYPLVTYTLETSGAFAEGDTVIYTISLNKPIDRALTFNIEVDETLSTVDEEDYSVMAAVIQPWTTEAQLLIISNWDIEAESDEVLAFEINLHSLADKYLIHPDNEWHTASHTIVNFTSDVVTAEFTWEADIDLGFGVYPASANVDFDVYMADGTTYDASDPWASFIPQGYPMATGSHPEVLDMTGFADGSYVFFSDFWSNAFYGYGVETPMPVTCHLYQPGVFDYYIMQDPSTIVHADMPGAAEGGPGNNSTIVKVVVADGVFTVSDYAGVLASGKSAADRTSRPQEVSDNKE